MPDKKLLREKLHDLYTQAERKQADAGCQLNRRGQVPTGQAPPMGQPGAVKDVTESAFEADVIARRARCPSSSTSGRVVRAVPGARADSRAGGRGSGGRVELVKVDTDANPKLAARYEIRGIPAVKAFTYGEVAREFVGVQSADFLRRWLAELAPSPARQALAAAAALVAKDDRAGAESALRALQGDPEVGDAAAVALAEVLLDGGRADDAEAALAAVNPRSPHADAADAARRRATFARDAAAFGGRDAAEAALARDPETSRRGSRWRARTPPRSRGSRRSPSCWSWSSATGSSATTARGGRCW